ncbi:MAG: sulfite exporter TauE/SafE family protein [Pseudomonadota bacterium]
MSLLGIATAVFVLAGLVKGVVGLGLPTIAMALLALRMTPAQAAALLIVPSLITNIWQIRPWGSLGPMLKRLAPMQIGVFLGTLAGAWALGAPAGAWAVVSLGIALIGYAAWGLSGARLFVGSATQKWLGPMIGAVTGMVTAATGVFVIPAVPYLQAIRLERDELIQAMGISFTVSTIALAIGLYFNDRYSATSLGISVLMLVPALVGMELGQRLRQKLLPAVFRKCFLISLILLGIHMIVYEMLAR